MINNKINKLKRLLYYIHGEKFYKRLNYNWSDYPSRFEIIQKIIEKIVEFNHKLYIHVQHKKL